MPTLTLPVHGMTCNGCTASVERALRRVPGVTDVAARLASADAVVTYDAARASPDDLAQAVRDAGYDTGPAA